MPAQKTPSGLETVVRKVCDRQRHTSRVAAEGALSSTVALATELDALTVGDSRERSLTFLLRHVVNTTKIPPGWFPP